MDESQVTSELQISPRDFEPMSSSLSNESNERTNGTVRPQASAGTCPTCAASRPTNSQAQRSYAYAIGRIEPKFPLVSIENEFRQATARVGAAATNLSDRGVYQKLIQDPNNRYLVRQLCWVLFVQGVETYILVPRDPEDYQVLADSFRAEQGHGDLDVVIGVRGPIASPTICNGLQIPIVFFEQIYSFDRESFLKTIPKPKEADAKKFVMAAGEMFDRIVSQIDNAGASDADRALNYLAMRYHQIYASAARAFSENASFSSVEVRSSPLSGTRNIVEVVIAFKDRTTDVASKYFMRVDVTDCFPFLVSRLTPYYDR